MKWLMTTSLLGMILGWQAIPCFADDYQLAVDVPNGIVKIHAHLEKIQNDETLCLPAFGQRYGEHFLSPRFENMAIDIQINEAGCFKTGQLTSLDVHYDLQMDEISSPHFWQASQLSANHSKQYLAFPGESLFIDRMGADLNIQTVISVTATAPAVTTLNELHGFNVQTFAAKDKFELTRSFWTFGNVRAVMASSGSVSLTMSVDPSFQIPLNAIEREISRILDDYASWMTEKTPSHVTVFIFSAPWDMDYHHGFARPGGIILQMGQSASLRAGERRILLAHELFHLYNGENLKYSASDYALTGWIREGMTQYIAIQTLLRLGLIDESQAMDWMSESIVRHRRHIHADDAYHIGYFLSMAIEQQWALYQTGLNLSLFWRWLSQTSDWSNEYHNSLIKSKLSEYSSFDYQDFFARYIIGKEQLPIESILKLSGLCLMPSNTWQYESGLNYRIDPAEAMMRVSEVSKNSPAAQADIRVGDIIAPAQHTSWRDNKNKHITVYRKNQQIQVNLPASGIQKTTLAVRKCAH